MNKIIYLCFVLLPLFVVSQTSNTDERIMDWVFPKENNFQWFNIKSLDKGDGNNSSLKISYYKISENQIGTSEEVIFTGEVSTPQFSLYQIENNEVKLLKLKTSSFPGIQSIEYSFDENNTFWKMPSQNETIKWEYKEEGGALYRCKSYWKDDNNEKLLVVEKDAFEGEDVEFSRERAVEYYKKNKGLYKLELFKTKTGKLIEKYNRQEGGVDVNITNQVFPLKKHQDSELVVLDNNKEKSISKEIEYPPGTIPKEYRMEILVDKGLPYLVRDTISIKNSRGLTNIPPPKFNKSDQTIFYNGESFGPEYIEEAKIIDIKYYALPYSTKQVAYYSDGQGNFKIVKNLGLYLEEDNKIVGQLSRNCSMKEIVDKTSELYNELSKEDKLKKQGIYIIRYNTSEENIKSRSVLHLNFTPQD